MQNWIKQNVKNKITIYISWDKRQNVENKEHNDKTYELTVNTEVKSEIVKTNFKNEWKREMLKQNKALSSQTVKIKHKIC